MKTNPSPNARGNIDKREASRKAPDLQSTSGRLAQKIQDVLRKIEDHKALFEKYAKKMDRVKKIYDRIKKIEEIFNGLLLSVSEARAENRAYVLNKLGVSQRLIREISYIDKNHQYLDLKKRIPKQIGDKYKCTFNGETLSVEITYKGKKAFAAVRSDTHGRKTIMYRDSRGNWHKFATISSLMDLNGKLTKLEKNKTLLSKAETEVRKLREMLKPDYEVKLDASDIKGGAVSILFYRKSAPNKKFASLYWKPGMKSVDVYAADSKGKWHNIGSISGLSHVQGKLKDLEKDVDIISKGAEAVRKLNKLLAPNYKAELNAMSINKHGEISVWLNTKDKSNTNFATIWWKPGSKELAFYVWKEKRFVESKPHPKTLRGVKARLDRLVKKISESPAALKEKAERVKKQDGIAKALIHLAKNEEVPAKLQGALKTYLATVQPNKFKTFEIVINRTLVRVAVARSKDGKYYKALLDASLTAEGEPPTILGKSAASAPNAKDERAIASAAIYLKPDGKPIDANDKPGEFPDVPVAFAPEKTPKTAKKTAEKAPTTPKGKLALIFKKIEAGGIGALKENIAQFRILIEKMGLSFRKDKISKIKVGGYTIATCGWSKHADVKPSIVVFKGEGPGVVLYKRGEYNRRHFGITGWQVSRMLPAYEHTTWTRRFAERMAANNALDKVLPQIKGREFTFISKQAQLMFEAALHKLSIYSGKSWKAAYEGGSEVHFNKATGYFKIILPQGSFYYHVGAPGLFIRPGTKTWRSFSTYSAKQIRGLNRLKKRMSEDKAAAEKRAALKKRQEETARKQAEAAKKKAAEARKKAQLERNQKQALRETAVDRKKYGRYITDTEDPLVFSIDFGNARNEHGEKLIDTVKINQLFSLSELNKQSKVLLVTITDAKGNKRYGMYYPGQKTVYQLDKKGGKQTNKPLRFSNKDKFQIQVLNPTDAHFKARTSVDRKVMSPDGIEQEKNIKTLTVLRKEFGKLKGKLSDLDLTKLDKFARYKPYTSTSILFGEKRLILEQKVIQKYGLKVLNKILRAEITVLTEGIKKLKSKSALTGAPSRNAPSATKGPGKRPGSAETEKTSPELLSQIGSLSRGDGVTFIKDGTRMAIFKDSNGKLHYITDLNSGTSSGPKDPSDFKDISIDTTKPVTRINGAPLLAAVKEVSPLGSRNGKTVVFNLRDGKEVRVKMQNYSIWERWARFRYSIGGVDQGVLHTKDSDSQVQAFVKISLNMKPNTNFRYE